MGTLELQGAKLHYHQVEQRPMLVLIPGANGTGDIFLPLAEQLKDHFTVVTVNHRDYGRSELAEPLPDSTSNPDSDYRVKHGAQNIAGLARSLSDKPIYILGSNSGSIATMHVLKGYPEVAKKIAFHEPPISASLPGSTYRKDKDDDIVHQVLTEGLERGIKIFGKTLNTAPIDTKIMSQPVDTEEGRIEQYKHTTFQSKFEIRKYAHSDITLGGFIKYSDEITLLNGTDSRGSFPQDINLYINKETGIPIVDIPGGHLGYAQKPEGFADVLLNTQGQLIVP